VPLARYQAPFTLHHTHCAVRFLLCAPYFALSIMQSATYFLLLPSAPCNICRSIFRVHPMPRAFAIYLRSWPCGLCPALCTVGSMPCTLHCTISAVRWLPWALRRELFAARPEFCAFGYAVLPFGLYRVLGTAHSELCALNHDM